MLTPIESVPFSAADYAISVAEMPTANKKLNELLTEPERSRLTDHLAFEPDVGECIIAGSGIRRFEFEYHHGNSVITVFYFFHDLNMPLFIIGVQEGTDEVHITDREKQTMVKMTEQLIQECRSARKQNDKKIQASA